VRELGNTHMIT